MSKNLADALNFVNGLSLERTNLSKAYEDENLIFENPAFNPFQNGDLNNYQSNSIRQYFPGVMFQPIPSNVKRRDGRKHSQMIKNEYFNPQDNPYQQPISLVHMLMKKVQKQSKIVIPSIVNKFQSFSKSVSLQSDIQGINMPSIRQQEHFMSQNSSSNTSGTQSTSNSSIRQRVKDINWPKKLRPPEKNFSYRNANI